MSGKPLRMKPMKLLLFPFKRIPPLQPVSICLPLMLQNTADCFFVVFPSNYNKFIYKIQQHRPMKGRCCKKYRINQKLSGISHLCFTMMNIVHYIIIPKSIHQVPVHSTVYRLPLSMPYAPHKLVNSADSINAFNISLRVRYPFLS